MNYLINKLEICKIYNIYAVFLNFLNIYFQIKKISYQTYNRYYESVRIISDQRLFHATNILLYNY